MIPSRSTSSPNISGVHLNATWCGGSRFTTVNIFLPTEKQRSPPHFTSSVTSGRDRQICRSVSRVTAAVYRENPSGANPQSRIRNPLLFVSERMNRIEPRRSASGPEARGHRDDDKKQRDRTEGDRI